MPGLGFINLKSFFVLFVGYFEAGSNYYYYNHYYYNTVVNARLVFHVVKNRKCGTVTDHRRNARR